MVTLSQASSTNIAFAYFSAANFPGYTNNAITARKQLGNSFMPSLINSNSFYIQSGPETPTAGAQYAGVIQVIQR